MNDLTPIQNNKSCHLLLFSRNENNSAGMDRWHAHDCWQAECICKGNVYMNFADHKIELKAGDIFLIPPNIKHHFIYNRDVFITWSLKFKLKEQVGNVSSTVIAGSCITEQVTHLIETLLSACFPESELLLPHPVPENNGSAILVESILEGLVRQNYFGFRNRDADSFAPADKLRAMIKERHGGVMTVVEAAKALGYSRCHASLIFKQHYGYSLKTFIDNERVEIARHFLDYSDLNVTEIAEAMEFSDVYHFSTFFKRLTGVSPLNYLKQK